MRIAAALAALMVAALSYAAPPRAAPNSITLSINSWGKPIDSWTIDAEGRGTYGYSEPKPGGEFGSYIWVTKQIDAGKAGFARLVASLAAAEAFPDGVKCRRTITDMPYGEVTWARGTARAGQTFDYGCHSRDADVILHGVDAADSLVSAWAKDKPVFMREDKSLR